MGFDYSEFEQYTKNFATFTKEFDQWIHKFLLNEGMRFIAEVKRRTPVDTGDLRNHWRIQEMTRDGDDLHVWFINPMYYATFVEYGHAKPYKAGAEPGSADWVEGYFMMTVSLEVIYRNMPARFEREFDKFITSLGVK